jgi:uncharacterized protein with HEPN domain
MMKFKEVKPHLGYILETLNTIHANTPRTMGDFMGDLNAQDATLMRLQDIGEQLTRIRDQFPDYFEANQDSDWHKIIGLRNIISHGYREIDFEIIWDIVNSKLGDFEAHIRKLTE